MPRKTESKKIKEWAISNFSGAKLGDTRNSRRLIKVATKMAHNAGKSIPKMLDANSDLIGCYRLLNNEKTTPVILQGPHIANTHQQMQSPGTYLLIEDTTDVVWSNRDDIEGLGRLGNGHHNYQSMLLHTTLAVKFFNSELDKKVHAKRPTVEIVGIASQENYLRTPKAPRRKDTPVGTYSGESSLWQRSLDRMPTLVPSNCRYVRIADRGADIYDVLAETKNRGYGYVIRARADRVLEGEQGKRITRRLFEYVEQAPYMGDFALNVRKGPSRRRRDITLSLQATKVHLRSPLVKGGGGSGSRPAHECYAVYVKEHNVEKGERELSWVLLTDMPITTYQDALMTVRQYACRWIIEEYHKALKTGGMQIEALQFETYKRLTNAIAIMSIIALRLLTLREVLRLQPLAPAIDSGLTELELTLLAKTLKRKIKTVEDVNLALGKLGGHLNRKADGYPGYQSLWEGLMYLQAVVQGYELALELRANS